VDAPQPGLQPEPFGLRQVAFALSAGRVIYHAYSCTPPARPAV